MTLATTLDASLAYAARRGREDFAQLAARRVMLDAAAAHKLRLVDLASKCKRSTQIRHCAIWLARKVSRASYPVLGRIFGGLHHTTVINAVRRVDSLVSVREAGTMRTLRRIVAHAERQVRR